MSAKSFVVKKNFLLFVKRHLPERSLQMRYSFLTLIIGLLMVIISMGMSYDLSNPTAQIIYVIGLIVCVLVVIENGIYLILLRAINNI